MAKRRKQRQVVGGATEQVRLNKVHVETTYQRDESASRVRRIADGLLDSVMPPPILVKRANGCYDVVDGQHRLCAVKHKYPDNWNDIYVNCVVIKNGMNAAELFAILNSNMVSVKPPERFKALLCAGYKEEKDIAKWAKQAGITFVYRSAQKNPGKNSTVPTAFRDMYDRLDAETCEFIITKFLPIYKKASGDFQVSAISSEFIQGLRRFWQNHADMSNQAIMASLEYGFEAPEIARRQKINLQFDSCYLAWVRAFEESRIAGATALKTGKRCVA